MRCKFDKSENSAVVTATGELAAGDVENLKTLLIKALIDADRVVLDMENVSAADLSCLQLLCSAHRSAARMNKQLELRHGRTKELNRVANETGYLRRSGCRLDSEKTCLWRISQEKGNCHE
jgi:anti-anti-sigma factor